MSTRSALFLVERDGTLMEISPSAPSQEVELQSLLAKFPQLIGDDAPLFLLQREHGIPDSNGGADRWSVDHLFVSRDAVPVLVEVKRAVDTRLRREVVGQMLDYAANSVAYWPAGSLRARFEAVCAKESIEPDEALGKFIGEGSDLESFWSKVDDNLRAGRIKLLFVADVIPPELARIVEFLNDQMRADVRAVELSYFSSPDGTRILAPRVIGETERTRAVKEGVKPKLDPLSIEDWLLKHISPRGPAALRGAEFLVALMKEVAPTVDVASTQGSIYCRVRGLLGKNSYPLFVSKAGTCQIGFGWLGGSIALAEDQPRREFYDRFAAAVGPLSGTNLRGYPSFPLERLTEVERRTEFRKVAADFVAASGG